MKVNPGEFIGRVRERVQEAPVNLLLYVGAGAATVLTLINFVLLAMQAGQAAENITTASEMRVLSQQMATSSLEAAAGDMQAFGALSRAQEEFGNSWDRVRHVSVPDPSVQEELDRTWNDVRESADVILRGEDIVLDLHDTADTLAQAVPALQAEYESIVEMMIANNADPEQVALAQRQSWLAERIIRSVDRVLEGGEGSVVAADAFGRDAALFGRVLDGMLVGDADLGVAQVDDPMALDFLAEIADLFDEFVVQSVDELLETAPRLFEVRSAADSIVAQSAALLEQSTALNEQFEAGTAGVFPSVLLGLILAGAALGMAVAIVFLRVREDRQRQQELEAENQRNQAAILRLLDELGDLADGDLTVQATVTEDFTGAIADSINYSIDQLRSLVQTINQTAVQVASAAQETQSTAMHLAEASEHQAQEIAGASAAVNEMAVSIDQVSANAAESAAVAERAVSIANKGSEVVQATIHGMDTIREQIQETSKRIKRLGESSQEIGDIVSLINDIADQTNILALNAAIQASMAGEAGRGFAVVADEVQRLAERSAAATKQIETLVKTIQTDTNEAVISMEHTTAEVVKGARLAQDAGVALEEIESVSKNLADLIQNISNAARQQAASAGHISNTMNVIQEITSQTSAGTTATAKSIGNLAEMAQEMRNSVAGFRLPEHG